MKTADSKIQQIIFQSGAVAKSKRLKLSTLASLQPATRNVLLVKCCLIKGFDQKAR
jgi:hypothetical protein